MMFLKFINKFYAIIFVEPIYSRLIILWFGLFVFFFMFFFMMRLEFAIALFQQSFKTLLDFLDLLLLLLVELLLDCSHVLRNSLLLHLLKPSQSLKILFFCHLSGKNISHDILFILLHGVERFTEL